MNKKMFMYAAIFYCCIQLSYSQKRNYVWCFGDSCGVDFSSLSNPIPITTSLNTRGSCASISDTSGALLFYSAYDTTSLLAGSFPIKIYNKNHTEMQNGDSLKGKAWYNEIVIVPKPADDSMYYEFHIGVSIDFGIYYSLIDLKQNAGLGAVTQKNIQLQSFQNVDCLNAMKHGNGRDWWVFFRRWDGGGSSNNEFHSYLISPTGITNYTVQNVGSLSYTGLGKLTFSGSGNKLAFITYAGLMEIYDFDRCTGVISNPINIFQESSNPPFNYFWGCEFSPNENVLYVTISDQTSYLFQFDLTAANIAASIDTLWQTSYPGEAIGGLKRGPDGKIYESGPYTNPSFFVYPYPDSVYNMYNMNLGVINSPDNLGAACDFQPYSFYLGGKRTYWGLPNNPDYDMGADTNSICDTITVADNLQVNISKGELYIWYSNEWQAAFINAQHLKGKNYTLQVYDLTGRTIFKEEGKLSSEYFTKKLNCNFANGIYIISLTTEKEILNQKVSIE